jgi:hypothetical protein
MPSSRATAVLSRSDGAITGSTGAEGEPMNTLLELIVNPYIISFVLLAIIVMADALSAAAR